jgi:hypothetical protein
MIINEVIIGQNVLCEVAKKYFNKLFKVKIGVQEPVLFFISPKIAMEDNERSDAPIIEEKLHSTFSQMHSNKSPSLDGFNPMFFQKIGIFAVMAFLLQQMIGLKGVFSFIIE